MLSVHEGEARTVSGIELWNEIYDLVRERLPYVPSNDPGHPYLVNLARSLAETLDRPLLTPIRKEN